MLTDRYQGGVVGKTGASAQGNSSATRVAAPSSRSLAELLDCPPAIGDLLGRSVQRREYVSGEVLFAQGAPCEALFLLMEGVFSRTAQRREKRLSLGPVQSGSLVELAAALGNGVHTYTLTAQDRSAALLFPLPALREALERHPPLRMRLLEELGREVSRAYGVAYLPRRTRNRAPRDIC